MDELSRKTYLVPFYSSKVMFFETCMFIDTTEAKSLLFPIDEIISVTSYGQDFTYKEGVDYELVDGKIRRTERSRIPVYYEYYINKPNNVNLDLKIDDKLAKDSLNKGKYVRYEEKDFFTSKQICVTYKHSGVWKLTKPYYQGNKVQKFINKLVDKENTTIVFYGDSITQGYNASGTDFGGNVPPFMPSFDELVKQELEYVSNTKINLINSAVSGKDSLWGLENVKDLVADHNPDLVVIAFGMNDFNLDVNEFKNRILGMINKVMESNKDAEFIIVSTTVPNNETEWFNGNQKRFINSVREINMPNVAFVNMTNLHLDLLKYKEFRDMTANNINHPNDFLIRIYAQMILGTILK